MAVRREDSIPGVPGSRFALPTVSLPTLSLQNAGWAAGLLLAAAATTAVVLTDDARYLRLALLAVCWAFLVAAFLAAGRRSDQLAAQAREAELRHTYELELDREVAARRAYERDLEGRLRGETEDGMRQELAELRAELAGFSRLQGDLTALAGLRDELAGMAELRSDLGRLRGELTEQLSGELLIERMVMRAQSIRVPAERTGDDRRTFGAPPIHVDRFGSDRFDAGRDLAPAPPAAAPALTPRSEASRAEPDPENPPAPEQQPELRSEPQPQRLHVTPPPPAVRHRFGLDVPRTQGATIAPRRHRRAAEPDDAPVVAARLSPVPAPPAPPASVQSAPVQSAPVPAVPAVGPVAGAPARPEPLAERPPWPAEEPGHVRLAQILAESGVRPGSGAGRRRRRDEDGGQGGDDVLARVLGRS